MLVFRIEDAESHGPYVNFGINQEDWCSEFHKAPRRPSPLCDEGMREQWLCIMGDFFIDRSYIFGFTSYNQIMSWFDDAELIKLHEFGFYISTYKVPYCNIIESSKQCAFLSDSATLISKINILERLTA